MPTTPRKARILLKSGKAEVVTRTPFTIRLTVATGETKQEITLGVDAGSKVAGLSATTEKEEIYASEIHLRNDIVELLSTRREFRRARRNRKTRYRAPRFNNRVRSKKKGWLAPSIESKIHTHLKAVDNVCKLLPISRIVVEIASFDLQKIKNPEISGVEYQKGEQLGFWNVREYVLWRDGYKCQGKIDCKNKILSVHHIESRKTGGNATNNLITFCENCHIDYHNGKLKLKLKRGQPLRDAAFMGIMRWEFYNRLKSMYPNVSMTYGYITKYTRINNGLEKTHCVDARCISGNPLAQPSDYWYLQMAVRRRNRQLHKATIGKNGYRKANQTPKYVFGYQLFDKVLYNNQELFVWSRRLRGFFLLRSLDGSLKYDGVSYNKLKLVQRRNSILISKKGR